MRALLATVLLVLALAAPVSAAKPVEPTTCVVDGTTVTATGLPIGELLNFFITNSNIKQGQVLGFTDTGTWVAEVLPRDGETLYEFASKTWGKNGKFYTVYSSCVGA